MQDPPDWEIRPARPDDASEVVDLLRTCLGTGTVPRSVEFWRWKHERSPFGPSPVLLAEARGRLVGVRAFLPWIWRSAGRDVPAVRAVDTATHPDWRGRGIFSQLTRALVSEVQQAGAAFVFNTPNRRSGPGYLAMGWRAVGRLPVALRPLPRPGRRPAPAAPPVAELLERPGTAAWLSTLQPPPGESRYHTPVTHEYLRWRYAEVPGIEYRAVWEGSGEAAAALVARTRRRRGWREVSVSQLLVAPHPASVDTAARLLRGLGTALPGHYAVALAAPSGTPEATALRRAGFLRVPRSGPRLLARPLDAAPSLPDPCALASWRLAAGTIELF